MRSPYRLVRLLLCSTLALPLLATVCVAAEEKKPKDYDPYVMYVFPAGGQRGTTVEVMARGRGLEGASEVRISGEGATAKVLAVEEPDTKLKQRSANRQDQAENPNVVRMLVTIAPNAELGERDLRIVTPKGVANRFRFVVGQLAEVKEVEPDEKGDEVQPLESLPILVNGQVDQGDRDVFRFTAKAGQTLVCDFQGQKLLPYIADAVPGWLQASMALYDAAGRELAYVDDFRFHPDPMLIYQVEKDGDYLVEIKDVLFRGREDLVYRLSIGELPCITHVYPLGGKRGSEARVELHGVNLPGESIKLPLPGNSPPRQYVKIDHGGLTSNVLPFAVDDTPEAAETEPNNAKEQANKIAVPVTINGRINQPGDVDWFVITAKAKQLLVMETWARRLESPMDSILTLYNSRGSQVATNDDTVDESHGLITHHCDSRMEYTFPADGDYLLQVRDVQGLGGEEYAYRLVVSPRRPDYVLRVVPDNPRVPQGGNGVIKIKAFRRDALNGPITLEIKNLPAGCTAGPAVIAAGQKETRFTVSAAADAPLGLSSPAITGTAKVGEESVVRQATPSEDVMQAFIYWHNLPSQEFALSVVKPGPIALRLKEPPAAPIEVKQGGSVAVVVKAVRKEGVEGSIRLAAVTPPRNVTVKTAAIAADKDEATVTITVAKNVPVDFQDNIILTGTVKVDKDNVTAFAPAIPIKVIAAE